MSTRPNKSSPVAGLVAAGVVLLMAILIYSSSRPSRPASTPQDLVRMPAVSTPVANPIEHALQAPAGVARREGVAVAILVDTSGSMEEKVPGATAARQRKIDIAKTCLQSLVGQVEAFCRAHPDKSVVLGLYEFSARDSGEPCRTVVPLGPPDAAGAARAMGPLVPRGNTPIGNAMIAAKRALDATGFSHRHILVITDGENNHGYALPDVVGALARQAEEDRASMYFIAFDVAASKFEPVKQAGGLVMSASSENDLKETLDYVLTGKILVEQPETPAKSK